MTRRSQLVRILGTLALPLGCAPADPAMIVGASTSMTDASTSDAPSTSTSPDGESPADPDGYVAVEQQWYAP